MKRASNSVGGNSFEPPEKRRKVRSCATCRRQKARCEFTTSTETCHRCAVLGVSCVFEGDAHANLLATHTTQNTRQFSSTSGEPAPVTSAANAANTMNAGNTSNGMNPSTATNAINAVNSLNGLNPNTFNVTPNGSVADKVMQDRLTAIEAALKEVLKATGLPALETFSQALSNLTNPNTHPVETPTGYQRYSSAASTSGFVGPSSAGDFAISKGISDPNKNINGAPHNSAQKISPSMNPIEAGFITDAQATELMAMMTVKRPFTFTVMCVLALRHKTTIANQEAIRAGMNKLLQRHFSVAMSARPYTVDAIHGLLIMSLWSSVLTSRHQNMDHSGVPDGWLLLATAVRMAQYLKLDTASKRAAELVQKEGDKHPSYEGALEEARVWYTLVTHDIAMSLGSVRPRLISLNRPLDTSTIMNSFYCAPSDACLAFHFDALFITSTIYNIPIPEDVSQIPKFATEVEAVMDKLAGLGTKANDAGVAYLGDVSCSVEFRMFRLYHQYCGCVCLSHASGTISSLSSMDGTDSARDQGSSVSEHSTGEAETLLCGWMCRICQMAENVLHDAFPQIQIKAQNQTQSGQPREPFYFSTAPDHLFTTVAFCAAILIQSQVTAAKCDCEFDRADEYDMLVEKTSEYLENLSVILPDAYLPKKYAEGLSSMLRKWRRKKHDMNFKRIIYSRQGSIGDKANPSLPNASNQSGPSYAPNSLYQSPAGSRSMINPSTPGSYPVNMGGLDTLSSTSGEMSKMPVTPNSGDELPSIDDASTFLDPAVWLNEQTFFTPEFPPQPFTFPPSMQSTPNMVTNSNTDAAASTFASPPGSNVIASKASLSTSMPASWDESESNSSPIYPTSAVRGS